MTKSALVTGGGGYIGSLLTRALLVQDYKVTVLDVFSGQLAGETHPKLELVGIGDDELHGGMADRALVERIVKGVDVIYHLALSWFGWRQMPPLADLFDVNIRGTLNLLEAARTQGVSHFLLASSETVYGKPQSLIVDEESSCRPELWEAGPGHPEPEYGILKLVTEKLCLCYHHRYGLPITVFRIVVVFDDDEALLLSQQMLNKVLQDATIDVVEGQGRASIHVTEVVQAFLLATLNEKAYGQVFNLSNPATYLSDRELYQLLIELTGSKSRIELRADPTCVHSVIESAEKAQQVLGWKPQKTKDDLKKVIVHTVQKLQTHV